MNTFNILVYVVVCGLSLWLGFYVRLRSAKSTLTLLIFCAAIGETIYFFWNGLIIVQPNLVFNRLYLGLFWWSNLLPLALWYHAAYLIWRHVKDIGGKVAIRWHILAVYAFALVCSVLRTTTDTILTFQPNSATDLTTPRLHPEALYFLVMLCVITSTGGACSYLFLAYKHYQRQLVRGVERVQNFLRALAIGSGLFCVAASCITINIGLGLGLPQEPAYLLTIIGYVLFSLGITRYNAWIGGIDVGRDLWYSLIGITILNFVYGGVFVVIIGMSNLQSVLMLQLLVCLTTFTYLYIDRGRALLSRVFLTQTELEQRTEALDVAANAGTMVVFDTQTENDKERIEAAVRDALTHFTETTYVMNSPLLRLTLVSATLNEEECEDTPQARLKYVQTLLRQHVENLRPSYSITQVDPAWRYYTILYYACIKGLTKKQRDRRIVELEHVTMRTPEEQEELTVLEALNNIPSATFFRLRNQALNAVAKAVYNQEEMVQAHTVQEE